MANWAFTKGLHEVGNGCWAYIMPDGSWSWSNAGLIADGDASLLVDTLIDLKQTAEMLSLMRGATPAAGKIDVLVNTHADGDHTFGNQLVGDARIVATKGTLDNFNRFDPAVLHKICLNAEEYGSAGVFIREMMAPFDLSDISLTPPTEIFSGTLDIQVGQKTVKLIEVGPAHSAGDALIHVPADKLVYTGDVVFVEGTPIAWDGPLTRWINACDRILELDVDVVVPGHGPVSDRDGVRRMRDYLVYVSEQARTFYDAGLDYLHAAYRIDLGEYRDWNDAERIVVTIRTLFDDFANSPERPKRPPIPMFGEIKSFRHHLGRGRVHEGYWAGCGCGACGDG